MARCPKCNSVLDEEDGIGTCPFCGTTVNLSSLHTDSKKFKNEPQILEEPDEVTDVDVDYEIRDLVLSFVCPKCLTTLDGAPEKCPNCGTKLKYIAVEDVEPKEEKEIEEEEVIQPTLDEPWEEDNVKYVPEVILMNHKVVSISRTLYDEDKCYKIVYRDGSEDTLSAKAMKLRGLMIKK